jgi:hypothetical protein
VSCEACRDIEEKDGVEPPCRVTPQGCRPEGADAAVLKNGCPIPPLSPENARVLEMRAMLVRLKDIVDPGTVLRMFGATREDVEMLAVAEDELKAARDGGDDQ